MKIISWNINGLRAAFKKGFLEFLENTDADIICLQEIKLQGNDLLPEMVNPAGFTSYYNFGERKGYAGTAIFTKIKPEKVEYAIGLKRFDSEGRVIKMTFADFTLFDFYIVNGGEKLDNGTFKDMEYKMEAYDFLLDYFTKHQKEKIIMTGDFNVAHNEIDLARPKDNQKNKGFLRVERDKIDSLLDLGFIDSFRYLHPDEQKFTWWTNRFGARAKNIGWRIDYFFLSQKLKIKLKSAFMETDTKGSDHCPLGIELN